jgi:hypothetical protein
VRYRLMATYKGSPFEAGIGPGQGDIVLFAACPPPEDLGFEPATGHWRKQLPLADVQAVWESRPVGVFRGERCMVLDDLGDRLHIGYLGHDGFKAEQLGYWQVDRGVFELVAPRSEVTDILEERTEYRHAPAASRPVTGPLPAVATDSSGSTRPSDGHAEQPGPAATRTSSVDARAGSTSEHPVPGSYTPGSTGQHSIPAAYMAVADSGTGVALPVAAPAPLPLEAEAMRAASAARRSRSADGRDDPAQPSAPQPARTAAAPSAASPAVATLMSPGVARQRRATAHGRQRRSSRARLATERVFADLAGLAGIPAESYAIGEVVDGAMCLVQTEQGFEVFLSVADGRQELQTFATEEAACFYLFGVLVADAVRDGSLARVPAGHGAGQASSD